MDASCGAHYWWGVATVPLALLVALVAGWVLHAIMGDEVAVIDMDKR
jgi:hypothetical protein